MKFEQAIIIRISYCEIYNEKVSHFCLLLLICFCRWLICWHHQSQLETRPSSFLFRMIAGEVLLSKIFLCMFVILRRMHWTCYLKAKLIESMLPMRWILIHLDHTVFILSILSRGQESSRRRKLYFLNYILLTLPVQRELKRLERRVANLWRRDTSTRVCHIWNRLCWLSPIVKETIFPIDKQLLRTSCVTP